MARVLCVNASGHQSLRYRYASAPTSVSADLFRQFMTIHAASQQRYRALRISATFR